MVGVIELRIHATVDAGVLTPIALMAKRFPGTYRLRVLVGGHTLTLGPDYACEPTDACVAALGEFGAVQVFVDPAGDGGTGPLDAGSHPRPDQEA